MNNNNEGKAATIRGTVTEALPSTLFRVEIQETLDFSGGDETKEMLAYLSGKMRIHRIKVLVGDTVEIVLDPYGGKGRIVKRL